MFIIKVIRFSVESLEPYCFIPVAIWNLIPDTCESWGCEISGRGQCCFPSLAVWRRRDRSKTTRNRRTKKVDSFCNPAIPMPRRIFIFGSRQEWHRWHSTTCPKNSISLCERSINGKTRLAGRQVGGKKISREISMIPEDRIRDVKPFEPFGYFL